MCHQDESEVSRVECEVEFGAQKSWKLDREAFPGQKDEVF